MRKCDGGHQVPKKRESHGLVGLAFENELEVSSHLRVVHLLMLPAKISQRVLGCPHALVSGVVHGESTRHAGTPVNAVAISLVYGGLAAAAWGRSCSGHKFRRTSICPWMGSSVLSAIISE